MPVLWLLSNIVGIVSKAMIIQSINRCKRLLESARLAYANKTRDSIISQKFGSCNFWCIANSVPNNDKSDIFPIFNGL